MATQESLERARKLYPCKFAIPCEESGVSDCENCRKAKVIAAEFEQVAREAQMKEHLLTCDECSFHLRPGGKHCERAAKLRAKQ